MIPQPSFYHILSSISVPPSFPFKQRPAPSHLKTSTEFSSEKDQSTNSRSTLFFSMFWLQKEDFFQHFPRENFGILITSVSAHHWFWSDLQMVFPYLVMKFWTPPSVCLVLSRYRSSRTEEASALTLFLTSLLRNISFHSCPKSSSASKLKIQSLIQQLSMMNFVLSVSFVVRFAAEKFLTHERTTLFA